MVGPDRTAHPARPAVVTKFRRQSGKSSLVPRERLLRLLRDGRDRRLTVIHGPAGFGKSTLAAQWQDELRGEGGTVGWLTIDDDDNNPGWLAGHLLAAIARADPAIEVDDLIGTLEQRPDDALPVLGALINRLVEYARPLTVVIDDWHLIEQPAAIEVLDYLLDFGPENLHIVVTSRIRVHAVSRLRVRDEVVEVDSQQLRFDRAESNTLLREVNALALDSDDVQRLWSSTDGWVAALQLATLSLRDSSDPSSAIARFSGRHQSIGDYLAESVLDALPADILDFLLSTSICDFLSADLVSAVSGRPEGGAMLEELRRRNMFLTALDDDGEWFRYHHLFSGYLRRRLARDQPGRVTELHLAAARWYAAHDQPSEAVDHALAAGADELAVDLVDELGRSYIEDSRMASLLALVDKLPSAVVAGRARLQLTVGWAYCLLHRLAPARRALALARAALDPDDDAASGGPRPGADGEPVAPLAAEAEMLATCIDVYDDRFDRVVERLQPILTAPRDYRAFVVAGSSNMASLDHFHSYRFSQARALQEWAEPYHERSAGVFSPVYGRCIAGLAAFAQLDLAAAWARYRDALAIASGRGSAELYARYLAAGPLGAFYYERGDLDRAEELLEDCYRLGAEGAVADFMILTYSTLARIRALRGDIDGAVGVLAEERRVGVELGLPRQVLDADHGLCRLLASTGDLAGARSIVAANALELEPSAARYSVGIAFDFRRSRLAMRAIVSAAEGDIEDAVAACRERLAAAVDADWPYEEVAARVALAEVLCAVDRDEALDVLLPALVAGARAGLARTLVDGGPSVLRLLGELRDGQRRGHWPDGYPEVSADYLRSLLAAERERHVAAPPPAAGSGRRALPEEELTAREVDILRLLDRGMSNSEIARRFGIKLNTVKWYLKNIYAKVGVTRRGEAVAEARRRGLLD